LRDLSGRRAIPDKDHLIDVPKATYLMKQSALQ
jgi:hypothetical protein